MKTRFLITAALVMWGTLAVAGTPFGAERWNGKSIEWYDFESGVKQIGSGTRPVLMVFYDPKNPSSEEYRKLFFDSQVVALSEKFAFILVDVSQRQDLNERFWYMGKYTPRTLFWSPDGVFDPNLKSSRNSEPYRLHTKSPDELLAVMQEALEKGDRSMEAYNDVYNKFILGSTP